MSMTHAHEVGRRCGIQGHFVGTMLKFELGYQIKRELSGQPGRLPCAKPLQGENFYLIRPIWQLRACNTLPMPPPGLVKYLIAQLAVCAVYRKSQQPSELASPMSHAPALRRDLSFCMYRTRCFIQSSISRCLGRS